jgi:hypothetical protein
MFIKGRRRNPPKTPRVVWGYTIPVTNQSAEFQWELKAL